jgi:hypothetical protein
LEDAFNRFPFTGATNLYPRFGTVSMSRGCVGGVTRHITQPLHGRVQAVLDVDERVA